MASAIVEFKNEALNATINTITVDGETWFRGKDVATALEYADTKRAIQKHVDEDDKQTLYEITSKIRGDKTSPLDHNEKETIYINESGLYSLIMRSKKPEAKVFK